MSEIFIGRDVVMEYAFADENTKPDDIVWHRLGIANPTRKRKPVKPRIIKKANKKLLENRYYLFGVYK